MRASEKMCIIQTLNEMLKNKELDRRTALAINNLGKRIGKTVVFADV